MKNASLRVIGLCFLTALLGMAYAATSAQAEPNAYWGYLVGQNLFKFNGTLHEPSINSSLENNHGILLTKIAGIKVEILCTAMTLEEAHLKLEGGFLGKVIFTGCKILLNGSVSAPCEPKSAGAKKGEILTLALEGLIKLHELKEGPEAGVKHETVLLNPENKESKLVTDFVTLEMSEECSIGEKIPINGYFSLKDCQNLLTHRIFHLVEEFAALTHLYVISDTAEHKATIDGSALLFLTGTHLEYLWAGTPG